MLHAFVLAAALLHGIAPGAALAQAPGFTCIGAEQLEEDVFAIPFARGAAAPGEAARANLAAAAERARRDPERNLCVLGHASPQEGGAQTGLQLAARRAGEVAAALTRLGIDRERLRAEARRAAFARGALPEERSVTVVLLPALAGGARPPEPRPETRPETPVGAPERPAGGPETPSRPAPPPAREDPRSPAGRSGATEPERPELRPEGMPAGERAAPKP